MNWYQSQTIKAFFIIAVMTVIVLAGMKHPESMGVVTPVAIALLAMAQAFMKPVAESKAATEKNTQAVVDAVMKATSVPPPPQPSDEVKS